jgi:hypothetical protein
MGNAVVTDRYVLLTGAKNNAGDFLIGQRASELFAWLRPDRDLIEYDRWKPLTDEQLEVINDSRALILTGGPALQPNMYPGIYPLVKDLQRITVPIIAMAIGCKSPYGSWEATHHYPLTEGSKRLLSRIENSGYASSVRDYHTLNVLYHHGYKNFLMTGCAALYSRPHIGKHFVRPESIRNLSFSLGVSFFQSRKLDRANKQLILNLREAFPEARFTVVFHHSTDEKSYRATHNPNLKLVKAQHEIIEWLDRQGVDHVDVSGCVKKLLEHYEACDLHVGYRVHAHIFMVSISRPTVLIAEDSRGTALKDVIGGITFDGSLRDSTIPVGLLRRLGLSSHDFLESEKMPKDVGRQVLYEVERGFPRVGRHMAAIDAHFRVMSTFLEQLP